MSIGPTRYFGEERVFVDREACIQAFRENIQNSGNQEYNVLFYHGIAGVGKSKLQEKLQKILNEECPEIFWVSIDLGVKTYRDIGTFLINLRDEIQKKHSAKFHLFNAVHAIYWKKLHPEIPLQRQNYPLIKKGEILDKIIDTLETSNKLSLAWGILNSASDSFRKWCSLHHLDISKIELLKPNKIEELLPGIFAADFFEHFGEDSKFYIFIDTYEALWDGLRNKGSFHEKDRWIRDNLIPNMLGVSWVICGREKLLWAIECDSDWDMYLEQHPVGDLPESYCEDFLKKCRIGDKDIRDVIIKASEGVPYYLNLSVDTYEKMIISEKRDPTPEDFGKTQLEIFNTFGKYLDGNEIRALEILSAPNFWDRNLFEILIKKFDPGLPIGAFSELIKFSFIKTDTGGNFSIHMLMRKSLQGHQAENDRKSIHQFLFAYYSVKIEDIDIQAITPEQEKALTEAFYHARESLEAEDLLKWFNTISYSFFKAAYWQLLIPIYEEILQILKTETRSEHLGAATATNNLAELYRQIGAYKKALSHYQRSLEIYEEVLGSEHPSVATTLNNLAELYRQMGDHKKALPLYQRALDVCEKFLGPQHPDVATILNNLGALYSQMGNYEKALSHYQRALETYEKALDPQDPQNSNVATTLDNLAELYRHMGYYDKALPLYQRALDVCEKFLGPQHPDVARTLNSLAGLYCDMGDYRKALSYYIQALNIREKTLGPEHPDITITLNCLAELYGLMGDYDKALPLYQRAFDIGEKVLGPQHPTVATTLNNLALLYYYIGDYEKALSLFQRALDIRENVLGPQHPSVAITLNNLAGLYIQLGDYEKAPPLFQRALEINEKVLGPQHPDTAMHLHNLAGLYRRMKDYEKALSHYQRVLGIYQEVLDPQHPDVARTLNNLALLYSDMGNYEKALLLYLRALDIREKVLGTRHPSVAITLNNLAGLYQRMGNCKKALPLYQMALDISEKTLGPDHPTTVTIRDNFMQDVHDVKGKEKD